MSSDLDKFIKLLAQTDGRDKIYKTLQGVAKILAWQYAGDKTVGKKYSTLAKSMGEGRSLMRMGKWVGNYNKLQGFAGKIATLSTQQYIEIVRVIGDFGYILGDNLAYLAKYGVLPLDAKATGKNSKLFQFWGYFCAVIMDLMKISANLKKSAEEGRKERTALLLSLVKDTCDLLATMAAVGYLSSIYKPSAGFTAACGTTSGAIATYNNWNKIK